MSRLFVSAIALIAIALLFFVPHGARADTFVVHLYYDQSKKTLNFDKFTQEKVSVNKDKFLSIFEINENIADDDDYILTISDEKNEKIGSRGFKKSQGAFSLEIPYVSVAHGLKITDKATSKEILSADLTSFSTCNKNRICEFEKGENYETCLIDCGSSKVQYSGETLELLQKHKGIIKDEQTGEILLRGPAKESSLPISSTETKAEKTLKQKSHLFIIIAAIALLSIIVLASLFAYRKYTKED